jgi:hypothetical protein
MLQGAPRRAPEPAFALSRVELDVKVHRTAPALVTALETVVPARAGASTLAFRLRSTFARWGGDASALFAPSPVKVPVRLVSVERAEGGALAFDHRQDRLLVKFPRPLAAGVPVKLRFRIQDDSFRETGKGQAWTLGNAAWFPLGSPEDPGFQVHCRLEVEKPCTAVAPGRIVAEEETAGTRILVTESDRPMTFYPCQGGALESTVLQDPRTQVALRFVSAPGGGGQGTQPLARAIQGLIAAFETFLGPFPVKDLVVVRGETGPEGAVAPGMLYLGESRYSHKATLRDEEIARALAGQYWGAAVRGRALDAPWIGGAFAQVCAGIALGKVGEQAGRDVERWTQDARLVNDIASLSHAAWLRPRAGDYSWETGFRSMLELGKGPLVLQRIRTEVGEKAFLDFLAELQRTFAWKTCDAEEVAAALARVTGRDWGPFFEKCYWGTELPE